MREMAARVAHQLLDNLNVLAVGYQQGRIGMPKGMPAEPFGDARSYRRGSNDFLQHNTGR